MVRAAATDHHCHGVRFVRSARCFSAGWYDREQLHARFRADVYIMWMGKSLQVAPDGKYMCILSTMLEGGAPELELGSGLALIPQPVQKFLTVDPFYEPIGDGKEENIFISKSYDATSHFETVSLDCLDLYERYSGKPITLVDNTNEG